MDLFKHFRRDVVVPEIDASYGGSYRPLFHVSFDGEKNTGELGEPTVYHLNYVSLRARSWQSYLDNPITQMVLNRYATWIVGSGLKLQSEPVKSIIDKGVDTDKVSKSIEDRFKIFSLLQDGDFSKIDNLNRIAKTAFINSKIGGDVLVVLRVEKGQLNIELVDGAHVETPVFNDSTLKKAPGTEIKNGIEENARGEHVAYWVKGKDLKYNRIAAKGSRTNRESAFLVYGLRYRLNDNRGIPLISTNLETIQKIDRYKEATVGSAEERAKIAYTIEHDENSTGENPLQARLATAFNTDAAQEVPTDITGKALANEVAVSTQKTVYNMPIGAKLKATETDSDINFEGFYKPNVESICSAIGIPPEVALSKYDSNFSASRAALKDWEHTINVERNDFSFQFYKKIYSVWLDLEILKNSIQMPGYLNAIASGDKTTIYAYKQCRFVGTNVPHIDPEKEVRAERLKLGKSGDSIPLTTAEAATEALNGGDYTTNVEQYQGELELVKKADIYVDPQPQPQQVTEPTKKKKDETK